MALGVVQPGQRIREVYRELARLQAELVHCVGEFDAARGYALDEYRSTAGWLRAELAMDARDASQMVGMARQLRQLPAIDEAFTDGSISQAHVALIARTARQVGAEHVAASQEELLSVAMAAAEGPAGRDPTPAALRGPRRAASRRRQGL